MKKLKTSDLTPAMLMEVKKLSTASEVAAFFQEKDYELSEAGAQKILDYLNKEVVELGEEDLAKVAGGCGGDGGATQS